MNEFDEIVKREPLTQANLDILARTLRPVEQMVVRLHDADLSKGAGVLGGRRKCIWTKDGHRITFTMIAGGGFLSSLSKEVDPAAVVLESQHVADTQGPPTLMDRVGDIPIMKLNDGKRR